MELAGQHIVVTGGAGGIGRALVRRFAAEQARAVVVADRDPAATEAVAAEIGGLAVAGDIGQEEGVRELIDRATDANGPIDIFFSNAGVPGGSGLLETNDDAWDEAWRVNVMAHVWAARALVPEMVERGEGYLVSTASAAGLLTQVSSVSYSATKHAAVALAEWLAIEYGDKGIRVSCLCPQAVQTPMLDIAMEEPAGAAALKAGGIIAPEEVADAVVSAIREERFLILPHPQVERFMAVRGGEHDRWLNGMRRIVRDARHAETG